MATKQEPIRRNDVIRCEKCGEDYSVTYKRCPFCDERPARTRKVSGSAAPGGRRVAGGASAAPQRKNVNPLQVAGVVGSLILFIAALYIVFSVVSPLLGGKDDDPAVSHSDPAPAVSQSQLPAVSTPDVSTGGEVSAEPEPEVVIIPANSIKLDQFDFTLRADEEYRIKATVDPADATVVWTSSDETVAQVKQDGTVYNVNTSSSKKVVTITASSGDQSAECIVRCNGGSSGLAVPPGTQTPVIQPEQPTQPEQSSTGTATAVGSAGVGSAGVVSGAGSGLNVRSGPGSSYERIASINNGADVKVIEDTGTGWYKISFTGIGGRYTEGYVSKSFITLR